MTEVRGGLHLLDISAGLFIGKIKPLDLVVLDDGEFDAAELKHMLISVLGEADGLRWHVFEAQEARV
jgi:hypothetical protein